MTAQEVAGSVDAAQAAIDELARHRRESTSHHSEMPSPLTGDAFPRS